jgi:hypothetical protein
MQMVKRIVGGFFLFILLMWLFAPKQELYYLLEQKLKEKDIIISNETVVDTWFGVNIQNADIYVKGIKMANVADLQLNVFFFYDTLEVENINIDEALQAMAPKSIDELKVKYSVIDPLHVTIDGLGSFGTASGVVDLKEKMVHIDFPVAKDIQTIKKFLKKDKTGGWYYETNY